MTRYTVSWTKEVEADSVRDAAIAARAEQIRPNPESLLFKVVGNTDESLPAWVALTTNEHAPCEKGVFEVCVQLNLFYEIPASQLPEWVDSKGVFKLVEAAFDNIPHSNRLSAFGKEGVLMLDPIEICINKIGE